ncbi:MAG: hypothetical protein HYX53_01430, partial [Chloroflexi bacterium]|nr:hypothetical protein [Chloroflexota bacterium]
AKIENYTTISTKVSKAQYGNGNNNVWWGWISEIADPEPTLSNFLIYNSTQPQWAQFGLKSDKIDQLTAQSVAEFDIKKRQDIGKDVNRELLKNWGAGLPYTLTGINTWLAWNYFKYPQPSAFVETHLTAQNYYFDQTDPTWKDRPA